MPKKEYYKHNLPHFQQPGQAYFVTWSLKDALPKHALQSYSRKLEILKSQIYALNKTDTNRGLKSAKPKVGTGVADSDPPFISKSRFGDRETHDQNEKLKKEYNLLRKKYIKAYNNLLDSQQNPLVDLSNPENTEIIINALKYWEDKKLKNHAFCIMPNHVHWVFELFEKDVEGNPVFMQDIMYSVKRFSSTQINKLVNRKGTLWQKESFDTTIRDEKHLYYAIQYTLNNPVKAGLVSDWINWPGCWNAE